MAPLDTVGNMSIGSERHHECFK